MNRVKDNSKVLERVSNLMNQQDYSFDSNNFKKEVYFNLYSMNCLLMDISKSLAVIADGVSEDKKENLNERYTV